jgi:putative endonuclease
MNRCYVYIMTNRSGTLYIGVTNHLERRVAEHMAKRVPGFTARYNITRLVFYEEFTNVNEAIQWEKRLKGWLRAKKIALIKERNPNWEDLSERWYDQEPLASVENRDPSLRSG